MSLFSKKPGEFKKARSLNDNFTKPVVREETSVDDQLENLAKEIFDPIKENIDIANKLLPILEEKCRATHIPVPEQLDNVRAAVRRKDSASESGDSISFGLFLTAIKKYEELKIQYSLTIKDTLSSNPEMTTRSVTNLKHRVMSGISEEDLIIFSSIWFLNYCLSKYQGIFNIPLISAISSKHSEGAGAIAEGAIRLTIASAFAAAVDTIYENIDTLSDSLSIDENIQTEQSNVLEGNRLDELAVKKISENDYDIILDYAVEYIYSSTSQAYDSWISYLAARQTRNVSVDAYQYYPSYSQEAFVALNGLSKTAETEQDYVESYLLERFESNFAAKFKQNTIGLRGILGQNLRLATRRNRNVLNTIAQTASYRTTKDGICCLVRILSLNDALDERVVKVMRAFIKAISSTSVVEYLDNSTRALHELKDFNEINYAIEYAKISFTSLLNEVFDGFYGRLDDIASDEVAQSCLAFLNLNELFIGAVEEMINMFDVASADSNGKLHRKALSFERDVKQRYILRLMSDSNYVLGEIIDRSLYKCNELGDDIADKTIDDAVTGLEPPSNQYTINIPEDVLNEHFSDTKPIKIETTSSLLNTSMNITIPAIDRLGLQETSEEVVRNILKTCKIDVSTEQIKQMLKDTDGSSR